MPGYTPTEFEADLVKEARTLHVAFRRAQFLLSRWYAGMNAEFPNSGGTIPHNNLMSRVAELIADYEANGNAKLNTVMALSDLTLPNDA